MYRMLSATKQTAFLYQYGNIMHGHWENTQDADVQLEQILAQAQPVVCWQTLFPPNFKWNILVAIVIKLGKMCAKKMKSILQVMPNVQYQL